MAETEETVRQKSRSSARVWIALALLSGCFVAFGNVSSIRWVQSDADQRRTTSEHLYQVLEIVSTADESNRGRANVSSLAPNLSFAHSYQSNRTQEVPVFNTSLRKGRTRPVAQPASLDKSVALQLPPKHENEDEIVLFVHNKQINQHDPFSATWWQSRKRFLEKLDPPKIRNVEGAVFALIHLYKYSDLRMTLDWLQFSVEHMSKAFKLVGFGSPRETTSYNVFCDKLLSYARQSIDSLLLNSAQPAGGNNTTTREKSSSAMPQTIALIANMPYRHHKSPVRAQTITTANLVATLASLIRVDCGRILIVVDIRDFMDDTTLPTILAAQHFLLGSKVVQARKNSRHTVRDHLEKYFNSFPTESLSTYHNKTSNNSSLILEFEVHRSQIALVVVNCTEENETKRGRMRMLPKAALLGLQQAYLEEANQTRHAQEWLGIERPSSTKQPKVQDFSYVYLTEPDTVLQTKRAALAALSRELDKGKILAPHRLQPIPHEDNFPNFSFPERLVPLDGHFSNIHALDSHAGRCCDAGPEHPGFVRMDHCGMFWWMCGFGYQMREMYPENRTARHKLLFPYDLMQLTQGSGLVSLAGSEHGRRCIPQTGLSPCKRVTT